MAEPVCWVVSDDGKVGTEHQCIGLAEALGYKPLVKRLKAKGIWRFLPPFLWFSPLSGVITSNEPLKEPWPDLIIGAGRLSVAPTAFIRKLTQGKTRVIQLQNPQIDPARFDAVIAPWHDRLEGPNVIQTKGALHRVTPERLEKEGRKVQALVASLPRPLIGVLVGGSNRCYQMTPSLVRIMAQRLKTVAQKYQAGLVVVISRRTALDNRQVLKQELKDSPAVVWTGEGENPYYGILALADYIIVTSDSVSMISEACFTGKPIYTYFFPGGSRKFKSFHQFFQKENYTKPFNDQLEQWSYPILNEFEGVKDQLQKILKHLD